MRLPPPPSGAASRTTAGRIVRFFARDRPCPQFGSNHDRQAKPLMFSVRLLKIVVSLCQSRQHASSLRIWRRQRDASFSANFRVGNHRLLPSRGTAPRGIRGNSRQVRPLINRRLPRNLERAPFPLDETCDV